MTPVRVVIAGGGTGGHLYPGIAIARELVARRADATVEFAGTSRRGGAQRPDATVTFAGTSRGIESKVVPREGFQLDLLRSAGLKGRSGMAVLRGLATLPASAWGALRNLARRNAD